MGILSASIHAPSLAKNADSGLFQINSGQKTTRKMFAHLAYFVVKILRENWRNSRKNSLRPAALAIGTMSPLRKTKKKTDGQIKAN
jgi:hypothetical protein